MKHIALTPFGRGPATLAQVAASSQALAPCSAMDKWLLFSQVRTARTRLGVTDRDLGVLHALLSFLPARELQDREPLVVFPSNSKLSARTHGMAESTLRRHLAALVKAGLIARRDSPNGKRYAARSRAGALVMAFGFDLRPLLLRAAEIAAAAGAEEAENLALRQRRAEAMVLLRDATKLAALLGTSAFSAQLDQGRNVLRRRLGLIELDALAQNLALLVDDLRQRLTASEESSGSDSQNGRHHQSQTESNHESMSSREGCGQPAGTEQSGGTSDSGRRRPKAFSQPTTEAPAIPLPLVLKACPEVLTYANSPPRRWSELVALADQLRSYMDITAATWSEARTRMGPELAAATLATMLQRFQEIRNPGGYLRFLIRRHQEGQLSLGSMIHALLGRQTGAVS